jgi:hypothetical protein
MQQSILEASKEEEFMSEQNSEVMEEGEIPDEIEATYNSFF